MFVKTTPVKTFNKYIFYTGDINTDHRPLRCSVDLQNKWHQYQTND